ncbi:DUF3530 family protein [Stutzerimonas azotifigens]|uniref:DUF3530 family protein n=1 Tax=Stutzerimonas azotifigens TaxID=291995 RepID=A0ABR5YZL8_9GAMM|nr:DUF3530 family protein [Stutzerimonas azotifigens]MBA1273398.1 DUF3530 family protein [Stutzerimonas azotifigens]
MSKTLIAALLVLCAAAAPLMAEEPSTEQPVETKPVLRAPLGERSAIEAQELARKFPTQARMLDAAGQTFIALWLPANTAKVKGTVILLPGDGQSADWPRGIGPLRHRLPDDGWHTLSLSLPDNPGIALPNAPEPDAATSTDAPPEDETAPQTEAPAEAGYLPEQTSAPEDSATEVQDPESEPAANIPPTVEWPTALFERITAGIGFARENGPATIVLAGQGSGAFWAARYLQEQPDQQLRHLVLIAPRAVPGEASLEELVPPLKVATGDFYYPQPGYLRDAAIARRNAARRLDHPSYHQVMLQTIPADADAEQEQLYRRIRGWLGRQS